MEKKNSQTHNIDKKFNKDIKSFIELNKIENVDEFVNKCFKKGFDIERYGLLGVETEVKEVEKIVEKVVEVPVEKIVEIVKEIPIPPIEVEVIKYVDREVIKEVPVEKIITKIEYISDSSEPQIIEKEIIKEVIKEVPVERIVEVEKPNEKAKMLESTLLNLRKDLQNKQTKINELESKVASLEQLLNSNVGAIYLKNSNLNQKL